MPIVLLAGIPQKLVRQVKAAIKILPPTDWDVRTFPAPGQNAEIRDDDIQKLLERAAEGNGAHVVGFHQKGDRGKIAEVVQSHFRFRWGSAELMWSV